MGRGSLGVGVSTTLERVIVKNRPKKLSHNDEAIMISKLRKLANYGEESSEEMYILSRIVMGLINTTSVNNLKQMLYCAEDSITDYIDVCKQFVVLYRAMPNKDASVNLLPRHLKTISINTAKLLDAIDNKT